MKNVTFNEMFSEYFEVGALPERDYKLFYLIGRYVEKVSPRLKIKMTELRAEGKKRFHEMLVDEMRKPNRLLDLISKDTTPWGGSFIVPIKFT